MYNRIEKKKYFKTIKIPENVKIDLEDNFCYISGPKGNIKQKINENIEIEKNPGELKINLKDKKIKKKELLKIIPILNTVNVILKNSIKGVLNPYSYSLNLKGIGYKAKFENEKRILQLYLGFTNAVEIEIKENIEIEITESTNITIKGSSKEEVGQLASNIKNKKPFEIYKGNGIRYKDEVIKLKTPKKKQK